MELRAIDADGHVTEPGDLWEQYIEPRYRDDCPKITVHADGSCTFRIDDRITVDDRPTHLKPGINTSSNFGARHDPEAWKRSYAEGEKGGYDPHARLKWLDNQGFDATVLFPTMALGAAAGVVDPGREKAIANAYNRWLADFCAVSPGRLFAAAILPIRSMEAAIEELDNAVRLGMKAIVIRPNPTDGKAIHHPWYNPLWQALQDRDVAVAVHGLTCFDNLGMDRFNSQALKKFDMATPDENHCTSFAVEHCFTHTAEMMAAATSFILAGVCDRFPRLRVGFVESGGAWMPGYVDRMDRHFDDVGMNDTGLTTRPSEIFARQCFISFEPVESSIAVLAEHFGPANLMVASDYPHSDGFPDAVSTVRAMTLKPNVESALLQAGFKQWYGLN